MNSSSDDYELEANTLFGFNSLLNLNTMRLVAIILTLILFSNRVKSQNANEKSVAFSIAGMEYLLETERQLLTTLENYANELEAKSKMIRSAIAVMRAENLKSLENAEEYLSNPLNSFALIRRMHTDWIHWKYIMQQPVGEVEADKIEELSIDLPSSIDVNEAIAAIQRLQSTYDLKIEKLATGFLNGKQYNASLSARDCFEIAQRLINQDKILDSIPWGNMAIQRYQENEINAILGFNKLTAIDLYVETALKLNMFSEALDAIDSALEISPNHEKYLHEKSRIENDMITSEQFTYRSCRGDFNKRLSRLHCRYNATTHAFLKLAPLKMEELYLDPYIVMYHDVISDAEISEIKKLVLPNLERSTVFISPEQSEEFVSSRTSKAAFFWDNISNTTLRIEQRIADMTGFDMSCAEPVQVINYGMGGHFEVHSDAYMPSLGDDVIPDVGNRICTVMFYLSDVDQGGATVFPSLQTIVYPRKGSVLMWYNLNSRGDIDMQTLHAGCPVLVGSKWVMTKWIGEIAQLFRRPCF